MVDITNRMDEADVNSDRYNMSVSPSKLMDTSFGDALTNFGNLVEGAATIVDNQIKRNIQSDLFNAVDQADKELGVTERVAAEASIDAPEPIKENMNKMANYKEAVAQGRMSETQFYNRMDSVIRQLRVKYPGYREEIDQLSGQVIGFDTANTVRKRMFAERDEAQKLADKRTEEDATFLKEAAKAGINSPMFASAVLQHQTNGYINDNLKGPLQQAYYEALALNAQADAITKSLGVSDKTYATNQRAVISLANSYQTQARRNISKMFVPVGPDGRVMDVMELAELYKKDGITKEEAVAIKSIFEQQKAEARRLANEFYSRRIEGSDKTFGSFVSDKERTYDGGLTDIIALETAFFGKELDEVAMNKYLVDLHDSQMTLKLIQNTDVDQVRQIKREMGPDAVLPAIGGVQGMREIGRQIRTEVANAVVINTAMNNTPWAQTMEHGFRNGSPVTPKQYLEGFLEGEDRIVKIAENDLQKAYSIFRGFLGPNTQGKHMLNSFSPQDRVKVFTQLASPKFSEFVRNKGTEQMKSEYSTWLRGAFEASFREDIGNLATLSEQDMIGYQLSYDPKEGFRLVRESVAGSAFSDITQSLAGNTWGVSQWRDSIARVNEFITTYRNALPESLTEKQQAEVLNEMIQSLGVGTEPSQAGGFWSQVANRVQNWITSGDSNVKVDPSSGVTTRAEFLGVDKAVGDLYEDKTNVDTAVKTAWGEGRGETPEGRIAIFEVLRNRALASGRSIDYEAKKGNGSQFNVWKEDDDNYKVVTNFNEKDPNYETTVQEFLTSANSDITKGATHYYNPDTSSPFWENLFVETARIGKHRFGYLKKDDPYRKRLSKYRDRSEFD